MALHKRRIGFLAGRTQSDGAQVTDRNVGCLVAHNSVGHGSLRRARNNWLLAGSGVSSWAGPGDMFLVSPVVLGRGKKMCVVEVEDIADTEAETRIAGAGVVEHVGCNQLIVAEVHMKSYAASHSRA